jgi:hypothetical protein
MGQVFDRPDAGPTRNKNQSIHLILNRTFLYIYILLVTKTSDLSQLPPELALQILKNLNATDLCLASCVWQTLANDEILWLG